MSDFVHSENGAWQIRYHRSFLARTRGALQYPGEGLAVYFQLAIRKYGVLAFRRSGVADLQGGVDQ